MPDCLKPFRKGALFFLTLLLSSFVSQPAAHAVTIPIAQDTTSSIRSTLTPALGRSAVLTISPAQKAFAKFDLAQLPTAYTAATVARARLRLYVSRAIKAGDLDLHLVTGPWSEAASGRAPEVAAEIVATVTADQLSTKQFVIVDVTSTIQGWLSDPGSNHGFAFVASGAPPIARLQIASKEGPALGFPMELEVELTEPTFSLPLVGPAFGGLGLDLSSVPSDQLPYTSGAGTFSTTTITPFARAMLDDSNAASARTTLGLAIGQDVQAFDPTPSEHDAWVKRSEFYDTFTANSPNLENRIAESGQNWSLIEGGAGKVEVSGGFMKWKTGGRGSTVYPFAVLEQNVRNIGCQLQFADLTGAEDCGAVMIISQSTDLIYGPFLHFTWGSQGIMYLDWYANGLIAGPTQQKIIYADARRFTPGKIYTFEAIVEPSGTVTFITPAGSLRLTDLVLPPMKTVIFELAAGSDNLRCEPQFKTVWANSRSPLMLGTTVQPYSPRLTELAADGSRLDLYNTDGGLGGRLAVGNNHQLYVVMSNSNSPGGIKFLSGAPGLESFEVWAVDWVGTVGVPALKIGGFSGDGGTPIQAVYSASAGLNFPAISGGGGTQDLTIPILGASVGDSVQLGLPAAPPPGIIFQGWVSAGDTVTIRATNFTASSIDPPLGTFRATVTQF